MLFSNQRFHLVKFSYGGFFQIVQRKTVTANQESTEVSELSTLILDQLCKFMNRTIKWSPLLLQYSYSLLIKKRPFDVIKYWKLWDSKKFSRSLHNIFRIAQKLYQIWMLNLCPVNLLHVVCKKKGVSVVFTLEINISNAITVCSFLAK